MLFPLALTHPHILSFRFSLPSHPSLQLSIWQLPFGKKSTLGCRVAWRSIITGREIDEEERDVQHGRRRVDMVEGHVGVDGGHAARRRGGGGVGQGWVQDV